MSELDPQCFKGTIGLAITNRGQLIPCCRCDMPETMHDPEFKKLLEVSYIADYDSLDQILKTKHWKRFYKNLKRGIGVPACHFTCSKNKVKDQIQETKRINVQDRSIVSNHKR